MVAGTVYEPKVDASRWRVYGAVGPKKAPKEETARNKKTRYYPADDVKRPLPSRRHLHKPARVRPSITEGTILILLAGRFRGKRVICLKPLKSGLLLVTGPFKVNGVPVRRVSQAYVIATSTKLDISSVDTSRFTDEYFTESKVKGMKKEGEEEFSWGTHQKRLLPVTIERLLRRRLTMVFWRLLRRLRIDCWWDDEESRYSLETKRRRKRWPRVL